MFKQITNIMSDEKHKTGDNIPKIEITTMKQKLELPDINLDDVLKKNSHSITPSVSPRVTKSPSAKWNCLCSPTTHAGSFRCRYHRNSSFPRANSVGSNLADLAHKGAFSHDG